MKLSIRNGEEAEQSRATVISVKAHNVSFPWTESEAYLECFTQVLHRLL